MKKLFPIALFVFAFASIMTGQIVYDLVASQSTASDRDQAYYNGLLQKTTFTSWKGKKLSSKKLQKGMTLINFWATWCAPCAKEFPVLIALKKKRPEVNILGVHTEDNLTKKSFKKFMKSHKGLKDLEVNFPIIVDKDEKLVTNFKVNAIPLGVVFKDGEFLKVLNGPTELKKFIKETF